MSQRTQYSVTRTFSAIQGERLLTVQANGGSVTIEVEHGDGSNTWVGIPDGVITSDTAKSLNFSNGTYRFTVAGGATYAL